MWRRVFRQAFAVSGSIFSRGHAQLVRQTGTAARHVFQSAPQLTTRRLFSETAAQPQRTLHDHFLEGLGALGKAKTSAEQAEATSMLMNVANQGHPEALFHVGMMHQFGFGPIPQNIEEAIKWYEKGVDRGSISCMSMLGLTLLQTSEGRAEVIARATELLKIAAESGDARALVCMGRCYLEGVGVPHSDAKGSALLDSRVVFVVC